MHTTAQGGLVEPTFGINAFWVVVSGLNFVLFVAVVYGVVRFGRWLMVGRTREKAEVAELRERVANLEMQGERTDGGLTAPQPTSVGGMRAGE
jgi:hypothetical protein